MDIYCQKCQKRVGQVPDEKIPPGKKASVTCPVCGEKIILTRAAAPFDPEVTVLESGGISPEPPSPGSHAGRAGTAAPQAPAAVAGNFAIGAVLKEAWQKTSGAKGPVWGAAAMVILVVIAMSIGKLLLAKTFGGDGNDIALGAALQITMTVAMYPFLAGVTMIGIRHSVGLPVSWRLAFGYFAFLVPIVVAAILMMLLTFLGFLLLILPGIYLSLAYSLTIPLVVDKGMGPWEAMEASRKAIHKCWFKVFGLYLAMGLIYLLSVIPLGLGLIWTIPMFVMMNAIIYRELFGVSEKA